MTRLSPNDNTRGIEALKIRLLNESYLSCPTKERTI